MPGKFIGTRNGGPSGASQKARNMIADELASQGPAWANTAGMIRAGFENLWLPPSLRAIDRALRFGPQGDDDTPDSPD